MMVLSVLKQGPQYGYSIQQQLREATRGRVPLPAGTLYPLLSKLRRDELVDYQWVESGAGPPRKYYRLTDKGQTRLDDLAAY